MAFSFTGIVGDLERLGFYDFVLPWLLFFAVILGILNNVKIFGEDKKINSIVAAVAAFFVVAFNPAVGTSLSAYFVNIFGSGAMILGVLLILVLLGGVLGYKPDDLIKGDGEHGGHYVSKWIKPLIGLVFIIIIVWIFSVATGSGVGLPVLGLDSDTWTMLFILAFVLLVIWYASGGGAGAGEGEKHPKPA